VKSSRVTNRVTPTGVQVRPATLADAISEGSRLTERDHLVISMLAEHKVMTAEQLARVAFGNGSRARHRLLILHQRGVLARFRHQRPDARHWIYTLGMLGTAVHAVRTGAALPRPAEITKRVLRLHYSPTLGHLLGVNDFFTRLIGHARTDAHAELSAWWSEAKAAHACGGIMHPDGYGEWTEHGAAVGFFYEHDTGTETLAALLGKVERYTELADTGITRPVLFDLPTAGRETNLYQALTRRYGPTGPPTPIATTSPYPSGGHEHHNPAGPIWLAAGAGPGRLRLIELARRQ